MRQRMAQLEIDEAEHTEREWRRALEPGLRAQLARERGMPVQRIPKPSRPKRRLASRRPDPI
jgi:hypothetical protein